VLIFLLLTYVILLFLCAFLSVAKCLLQFTALSMFSLAVVFSPCRLLLSASVLLLLCNASFPFHFTNLLCHVCTRFVPVLSSTRICPRVIASTFVPATSANQFPVSHFIIFQCMLLECHNVFGFNCTHLLRFLPAAHPHPCATVGLLLSPQVNPVSVGD